VEALNEVMPWLIAMAVLIACSAFFSASEAALFSLRQQDRRFLKAGTRAQRLAAELLNDPDRLLSAVLFWNLVVNMTYFAVASIAGFRLEGTAAAGQAATVAFAAGSVLAIIFFSEMLPKTLAVTAARTLSALFAVPLAVAVRAVDPLMPALRLTNLLSRRLIWAQFRPEPYLDVSDLERAIEASAPEAKLADQERIVLSNVVAMSDIRADEWMRPRTQFQSFRPPVSLADLEGKMTPSGYLLVTERDGDEITAAIDLQNLVEIPSENLEDAASPVSYVPWCATVADAFQQMRQNEHKVVAVVNEFGDTTGILTFEDILDTVFTHEPSRSGRLWNRAPITEIGDGVWQVIGVTSLRRLGRYLEMELPPSRSTTLAGVVQETLQRLPIEGDSDRWGPFVFRVIEASDRAHLLVELTRVEDSHVEDDE